MARDTNFYYSFLVLPALKRAAIIAVWDFCRAVDDAVDEPGGGGVPALVRDRADGRLDRWRAELHRCFKGCAETPEGRRLQPHVARFGLPRERFEDLIGGVAMDLDQRRYETFADLREYCRRVASTVGLICVEIFGYRDPRTRTYAEDLGIALQLTNILRDVGSDLARGRLYVPLEDLARFACTEDDLRRGVMTDRVRALLAHQWERARTYYERARTELPPIDARRLVAAEIMKAIYFEILMRIRRSRYDVFSRRIGVPRPRRAVIAAATWAKTMMKAQSEIRKS